MSAHRILLCSALALASIGAQAGPSDHTFAWTHVAGSAVLMVNGSTSFTATNRGWVTDNGTNSFGGATSNYIAGVCGSSDSCSGDDRTYNNYFSFDVGRLGPVTSVTLMLLQPNAAQATNNGFLSQSNSLTYSLWDALLDPTVNSGVAMHVDLGSGTSYGSIVVDATTNGTTVSISFNAAGIAAVQAAGSGPGVFQLGGTTTPIPEPGTYALMLAGLGAIGFVARRRRS